MLSNNTAHSTVILSGLDRLRANKILTDVTLIAENKRFDVHKVVLASCSDYFGSMFTSGMKESHQNEIELKGLTAKGLEKVIEIIYTSNTNLESDDMFELVAAATHLQCTPVIEYCEKNLLSCMNTKNFNDFIQIAKMYNMNDAQITIDNFVMQNLMSICVDGNLKYLAYDQLADCIRNNSLRLKEIDVFALVWQWLNETKTIDCRPLVNELVRHVRFALISPIDIVNKVQCIDGMMCNDVCRELILNALNYHVVPYNQTTQTKLDNRLRAPISCIISVGGREINPNPRLHDFCYINDFPLESNGPRANGVAQQTINRRQLTQLPCLLSHMQVVVLNNFLFVLGGCSSQCAHGESAVNNVYRYDPRFNTWFQVASMTDRRSYFFACALDKQLYAIGGKNRDGAISTAEVYDASKNEWKCIRSMPAVYHAHAGTVHQNKIYITGGYSQGHFTSDLQIYSRDDDHWDDLTPMHMARGWHTMAEAVGRLYVFGGCHLNANQQAQAVVQTEFYMPAYDQWTIVSSLISLHKEASCVKYSDFIFVLGGYNLESKCGQRLVSRYDYKNDTWDSFGQLTSGQTGVGYCILDLPWYSSCANESNESN